MQSSELHFADFDFLGLLQAQRHMKAEGVELNERRARAVFEILLAVYRLRRPDAQPAADGPDAPLAGAQSLANVVDVDVEASSSTCAWKRCSMPSTMRARSQGSARRAA